VRWTEKGAQRERRMGMERGARKTWMGRGEKEEQRRESKEQRAEIRDQRAASRQKSGGTDRAQLFV
jgi:hypothetical protein